MECACLLPDQAAGALAGIAVERITFSEVTQRAVRAALQAPRDVSQALVDAYLARRGLDYLFGFTLSPLLWRKLPGARSAGARPARLDSTCTRLQQPLPSPSCPVSCPSFSLKCIGVATTSCTAYMQEICE